MATNKIDYNKARCVFCGGLLSFEGSEMVGTWRTGYENDEVAQVNYVRCRCCGRDYEIFDPTKEERETDYKDYWEEH